MIDLHHDLLSILYYSYLRDDFSYVEKWIKHFHGNNVSGLLANMYFMNPDEMKKEMGDRNINVVEMFGISVELFKKYLPDEKVIFSIEGCDYIKDTLELEELYKLGLRNILLVWNNPNKYGSGIRGDYGLTDDGKEFLRKAIDLGISIDLSHMNKKTFFDSIDLIREEKMLGKKVRVLASHSNCYSICSHERNLDDRQLLALRSVDGLLGIVEFDQFVRDERHKDIDLKKLYLEHIRHAISIMGINLVGVSTDDMIFYEELFNKEFGKMIFYYETIANEIRELLKEDYNEIEINKIMYQNAYNKLFLGRN